MYTEFVKESKHLILICNDTDVIHLNILIATGFTYFVNDEIATLGGLFIKPNYRKQGVGKLIWDARMRDVGDRNTMVNAVERRAPKNIELGFDKFAYLLNIFSGVPSRSFRQRHLPSSVQYIVPINRCNLEKLIAYDCSIHAGIPRGQYLKVAIEEYSIKGQVALKDDNIVGYIGSIPADGSILIGPWYADSFEIAKVLLFHFIRDTQIGLPIQLIVPEVNQAAQSIITELGMQQVDQWSCLFNRNTVDVSTEKIYAVANPVAFVC